MGFSGYFLIVWDFIRYAKEHAHPGRARAAARAPGRWWRTACASPTSIPSRNKLLFERFLNPERVSMPDFDIDFCMNRRDEVINYVTDKYGKDNVGQIITMHQIKARSGVRDIGARHGAAVRRRRQGRQVRARADPGQVAAHRRGASSRSRG